jgi:RimJ/RimL family protein N-acetyltransferase
MELKCMLEIKTITEKDHKIIVDWNIGKDNDYLIQWAGPKVYHYPITIDQIKKHDKEKNSKIFMIFNDNIPIGSIELDKIDDKYLSAHISRFIICDEYKNKGYGTMVLKELVKKAFNDMGFNRLTLSVFCYNIGAMRCYEKVGFLVKEYNKNEDSKWNSYIMEIKK